MRKYFGLFALLLLISTLWSTAQMVETKAKMGISKDSILIGDTLTLYIDIEKDMAQELAIPDFKEGGMLTQQIEIIEGPTLDTISLSNRTHNIRIRYVITSFEAGGYIIDSFPVLIGNLEPFDTLYTRDRALLSVGTFEIDTTKDAIADILPIIDTPYSWDEFVQNVGDNWLLIAIVAILVVGMALGYWFYMKRKRAKLEARKALPPHIRAINSLENIHNQKLWQEGKVKEYFSAITDILRIYMEERYGIYAMEMTSSEIIQALRSTHTEDRLLGNMTNLFELSDLVKFAKVTPEGDDCETAYFDAYYYVEQTKPEEVTEPITSNSSLSSKPEEANSNKVNN